MNNSDKVEGGPFTRIDPARPSDTDSMSCLSLVIVSKELESFIEQVSIDSKQLYSPISSNSKHKVIRSDHFPVILTFSPSFSSNKESKVERKETYTMWNTNKPGGWERYKENSNRVDLFKDIVVCGNEKNETTELMAKLDKAMTKVNHMSFGKVKRREVVVEGRNDSMKLEDITREKRREVSRELEKVEKAKEKENLRPCLVSSIK